MTVDLLVIYHFDDRIHLDLDRNSGSILAMRSSNVGGSSGVLMSSYSRWNVSPLPFHTDRAAARSSGIASGWRRCTPMTNRDHALRVSDVHRMWPAKSIWSASAATRSA